MMKLKIVLLTFVIFIFLHKNTYATFSIDTDLARVDFGLMSSGDVKDNVPWQGVTVKCTSDQGNPWDLRIRMDSPFTHENNPSSIIANDRFWWYGANTTGLGTLITSQSDFSVERIVYQAPMGEGTAGINVGIRFKLAVPPNAQSGRYAATIILTMIE